MSISTTHFTTTWNHLNEDATVTVTHFLDNRELAKLSSVSLFAHQVVLEVEQGVERALSHVQWLLAYFREKIDQGVVGQAIGEANYQRLLKRHFKDFHLDDLKSDDPTTIRKIKVIYDRLYTDLKPDIPLFITFTTLYGYAGSEFPSKEDLNQMLKGKGTIIHSLYWKFFNSIGYCQDLRIIRFFMELRAEQLTRCSDECKQKHRAICEEMPNEEETVFPLQDEIGMKVLKSQIAQKVRDWLDAQPEEFYHSFENFALDADRDFNGAHLITNELISYISKMKKLKVLDLSGSGDISIEVLPESLTTLSQLEELRLKNNRLLAKEGLPASLLEMANLKLIADFNHIPWSYPVHKWNAFVDGDTFGFLNEVLRGSIALLAGPLLGMAMADCVMSAVSPLSTILDMSASLTTDLFYLMSSLFTLELTFELLLAAAHSWKSFGIRTLEVLVRIAFVAVAVFGIMAITNQLLAYVPVMIPKLVELTGYSSETLLKATTLALRILALIAVPAVGKCAKFITSGVFLSSPPTQH